MARCLTELSYLDLGGTQVTDAGLAALARFRKLEHLELNGLPQVSDAGLEHLKTLDQLKELHLYGTKVIATGGAELQKVLSKCQIRLGPSPK